MTAPPNAPPAAERFPRHLRLWVDAICLATGADQEHLLNACINHAIDEWPVELCDIEQLADWTHEGLLRAAMAPKAPPCPEPSDAQHLLTLRTLQMVGKLALATEQALHLGDRKTAIQMLRLTSREWTQFKGNLAIEAALDALGAISKDREA